MMKRHIKNIERSAEKAAPHQALRKKNRKRKFLLSAMTLPVLLIFLVLIPINYFHFHFRQNQHIQQQDDIEDMPHQIQSSRVLRKLQSEQTFAKSPSTVVTAYFQIRSKYQKETYLDWMSTMLSVQDPMIIFTTVEWVESIRELRKHALNRTYFVTMELTDLPLAKNYTSNFWQSQLDIDPEKKRHAGYEVFWIWLSKTWFVSEGIRMNPFQSKLFMWSDIGCYRGGAAKTYAGKTIIKHPNVVPKDRVLFLSHKHLPIPPKTLWWNKKLKEKEYFYHSGSQMLGYSFVFVKYHTSFLKTLNGFLEKKMFIGDDQPVFQCTCLQNPDLCAYITRDQVKDNHYFGLRYAIHYGGEYKYWYPPHIS
mmetsp:Transcript_11089/g.17005  ORF Transcript_11089/g.17005 Transcript_11089/m.17005 type:complete len:364 (-) Transcript_11089:148-1239(-)|eukprot:CAMPEP_0194259228 /NCGR_PEP_ID=MMETSP0158-20130606/43108_1 /TAXON_ID=33649 /ORGANISM="Thalassionema nitzschioides, Strain L26-B" /LENGTH=363 /DNA_ID=CAMNT_0038998949 /DNA_START=27 /DNA_END=1118 /DNA_ORIENTATION=+